MKRRLLNLLTLLSLLVCAAVVVLWVRSYWFVDTLRWPGGRVYSVGAHNGLVVWNDFRPDPGSPPLPLRQTYHGQDPGYDWNRIGRSVWNRAGFGLAVGYTAGNNRIRQVTVPYWFLSLAAAVPCTLGLWTGSRRLRRSKVASAGAAATTSAPLREDVRSVAFTPDEAPGTRSYIP